MSGRFIRTKEQIEYDISVGSRVCKRCGERKEFKEFNRDNSSPDNVVKVCKKCQAFLRKAKTRRRTEEEFLYDIENQSKVCIVCNNRKPFTRFHNSRVSKDGKGYRCIECDTKARKGYRVRNKERVAVKNRITRFKSKYNLTEIELVSIMDAQKGCCLICTETLIDPIKEDSKQYGIDHNHNTGEVRGLLCHHCNAMLGQAKDSPSILLEGYKYLLEKGYYGKD